MPDRDAKIVGRLGEKTLDSWATQAGITINRAYEDEQGWDFILEFPLSADKQLRRATSLDRRSYPLKCFIQVKSSDDRRGTWSVKLDNWERLVKNPLPTFFLVCEFDGDEICQRAYLVHIDEVYIRKVLKRLREASAKGIEDIHKCEMVFHHDEGHRLPRLDGFELAQLLRNHIGTGLETYSSAKMESVRTIGYETDAFRVSLTVQLPDVYSHDPMEFLVDAMLGIVPEIGSSHIVISDQRFGIEVPGQAEILDDAILTLPELKSVTTAVIRFFLPNRISDLRIAADTFVPQGIGFSLDEQYRKIRFRAPFIELVTRSQARTARLRYSFPTPDERHALKDLRQLAELIELFKEGMQANLPLNYEILLDSGRLAQGLIDLGLEKVSLPQDVSDIAGVILNAWTVAKYADIQDTAEISISQLLSQSPLLEFLEATVQQKRRSIRLEFSLDDEAAAKIAKLCCPILPMVVLGETKLLFGLALVGIPTRRGADIQSGFIKFALTSDCAMLHGSRVIEGKMDIGATQRLIHEQIVRTYEPEYDILTIAGFHDYL